MSVKSVLAYLGFDHDSQKLVSRVMKKTFPLVEIRREDKSGIKQYPFDQYSTVLCKSNANEFRRNFA